MATESRKDASRQKAAPPSSRRIRPRERWLDELPTNGMSTPLEPTEHYRFLSTASEGRDRVVKIVATIFSCILLTSCHEVTPKELEEEVSHLAQKGMPMSTAISQLQDAGFDCSDTGLIPEEGFDGFMNPPPRGLYAFCSRRVNGIITCNERLLVISDQNTSKISLISVEDIACIGTP